MNPERYLNDAAIFGVGFGPERAGDHVARMALEVTTPFAIGVTGKWGSGKTSVLRRAFVTLGGKPLQVEAPLSEALKDTGGEEWGKWVYTARADLGWDEKLKRRAERSLCVWYSPWQHQNADNPLVPLLLEMRKQFTTRVKLRTVGREINRRGGLAGLALLERVLDSAASLVLDRDAKLAGTTEAVRKGWREASPAEPGLDDGQRFHLLFEDAVQALLDGLKDEKEKVRGRLVVFVDDLDRCEERSVVQLLEAIKLYLGSEHCVFVMAMDESAIQEVLSRHWQNRSEDANREYLEKLFQAMVPVPTPRPELVQRAVKAQLDEHGFPPGAGCEQMIVSLLELNPRKVKNFVNSICASWALFRDAADGAGGDAHQRAALARRFVLFHYLRWFHKPVWRLLERQPWVLQVLHKVVVGGPDQQLRLPREVEPADQRVLELLLSRSFAHVLRDTGESLDPRMHRSLPLAEAVELLGQRLDRKRSDECFIGFFKELVSPGTDLPCELLYLPGTEGDG